MTTEPQQKSLFERTVTLLQVAMFAVSMIASVVLAWFAMNLRVSQLEWAAQHTVDAGKLDERVSRLELLTDNETKDASDVHATQDRQAADAAALRLTVSHLTDVVDSLQAKSK